MPLPHPEKRDESTGSHTKLNPKRMREALTQHYKPEKLKPFPLRVVNPSDMRSARMF